MTKQQARKIIRMYAASLIDNCQVLMVFDTENMNEKDAQRLEDAKEELRNFLLNKEPLFFGSYPIVDWVLGSYQSEESVPKQPIDRDLL